MTTRRYSMSANLSTEFFKKQAMLRRLTEELDEMQGNPELEEDVKFRDELESLLQKYGKSSRDAMIALDPFYGQQEAKATADAQQGRVRKKRIKKIYKHPETGEMIETRGGNHNTLKAWKAEHGSEEVEKWLVGTEE